MPIINRKHVGLTVTLRWLCGPSFPPLVIWSKFSSSLITRITVPSSLLHCFSLLCPPTNMQVGGRTLSLQTRVYEKYRNASFCSKIKIHLSVSPHLTGPPRVVQKPLGTYLDRLTSFRPSLLVVSPYQSSPMCSVSKLSCSLKIRQLCWFLPRLAQKSLPGLKAPEPKVQPL